MTLLQILFLLFAVVTLVSSFRVVTSRRLIHAALWLILSLAGVAALFILLNASFLAIVQVVIYIGAIAILIIFAVMLTRRVMEDTGSQVNRNWWMAGIVALLLFGGLMLMFREAPALAAGAPEMIAEEQLLLENLGRSLVDVNRFVLPFEVASILLVAAMIGAIFVSRPLTSQENKGGEE